MPQPDRISGRVPQHKPTKAERKQEKGARKRQRAQGVEPVDVNANGALAEELEASLARIEAAATSQAAQTQSLLEIASRTASLWEGAERALRLRRENVVPVREPLALICQAQRSGGTLLARLFDGHPQCHAHPHELHIGARRPHSRPHAWPDLRLDDSPDALFGNLSEDYVPGFFTRGRRVIPMKAPNRSHKSVERHPFILPPTLQRLIFLDEVERRSPISSEREILDCYMTSLFNAWLDNQNLYTTDKRWVVAFSPRRAWGDGLERYFQIYPEGRMISILRDPRSWYTSAQGRDPNADMAVLLDAWKRSAGEMLRATKEYGEQVCVVRFEQLVLDTTSAMKRLAEFLDIEYTPVLTVPTFNNFPFGANSSFETSEVGVVTAPVDRYASVLSDEQQKRIARECHDLYQEALALTESSAS